MSDHRDIERRSLRLAEAVASKLDAEPEGLEQVRALCARWLEERPNPYLVRWSELLELDWPSLRQVLLDPDEVDLRQNSPFCGILTPHERWQVYAQS